MTRTTRKIGVIGAGAWGTALAQVLSEGEQQLLLWAREPETVDQINRKHENRSFLPDHPLREAIVATQDWEAMRPAMCSCWSRQRSIFARLSRRCRKARRR